VSAGLAYSLYGLHVRPSLCRTSASEVALCDLRRYTSVICLCLCHQVEDNRKYRVHSLHTKVGSSVFRNSRSVFWRENFASGRYVLFPCTFDPSLEGQFLLRCYAGHAIHMRYDPAAATTAALFLLQLYCISIIATAL